MRRFVAQSYAAGIFTRVGSAVKNEDDPVDTNAPARRRRDRVWPFVHIEDAAEATVQAIEVGGDGIDHVVDDEPAPVADWLPAIADAVGARSPWRVPRWLGRLFATVIMTEARRASDAKAKRQLAWAPRYASWREGFMTGLG